MRIRNTAKNYVLFAVLQSWAAQKLSILVSQAPAIAVVSKQNIKKLVPHEMFTRPKHGHFFKIVMNLSTI